jgi:polysaccharide export outer membrane protein
VLSNAGPSADSTTPVAVSSSSVAPVTSSTAVDAQPATRVKQQHAPPGTPDTKSTDVIRVGEMLHIVFSDTPTAIPTVDDKVRDDGNITLMYNERFHAADKTPQDLAEEIRKRYVPNYFAQLTASVNRDIMRAYYVDGEVRNPSKQLYTGPMTVTQAIASAGGFTDFANRKKVRVIRANGKTEIINCKEALEHPDRDPEIFPGDKVHVPRSIL